MEELFLVKVLLPTHIKLFGWLSKKSGESKISKTAPAVLINKAI